MEQLQGVATRLPVFAPTNVLEDSKTVVISLVGQGMLPDGGKCYFIKD